MRTSNTFYRDLPVALSDEEFQTKSQGLADLCKEINRAKDRAKEEAKANKEAIDAMEIQRSKLATIVKDKAEDRPVECCDHFLYSSRMVETVRTDTGERIAVRAMRPDEYQEEMDLRANPADNVRPFGKTAEA
jgi:hypothetical protein